MSKPSKDKRDKPPADRRRSWRAPLDAIAGRVSGADDPRPTHLAELYTLEMWERLKVRVLRNRYADATKGHPPVEPPLEPRLLDLLWNRWDVPAGYRRSRKQTKERQLDASFLVARLRQAREEAGVTQLAAATEIGKGQSVIAKIEAGDRRLSSFELRRLLKLYGKPETFVMRWADDPTEHK